MSAIHVAMKIGVALSAFCLLGGVSCTADAASPGAAHAAACVAALQARETVLAASVKSGGGPATPELLNVVRGGIAIIGKQYLGGLGESEGRGLLSAAQKEFDALPPAVAQARQRTCLGEGRTLFDHASSIERSLITSAAQRRIKRLTTS